MVEDSDSDTKVSAPTGFIAFVGDWRVRVFLLILIIASSILFVLFRPWGGPSQKRRWEKFQTLKNREEEEEEDKPPKTA